MLRLQRHPVQPRIAAPRRDVRHPQDHPRPGAHQPRPAGLPLPRQPRRAARLGLRARLRRGEVADAAAGRAGRLRHRHRRAALGPRVRRARRRRARHAHRAGAARASRNRASTRADAARRVVRIDPRYFRPTEVDTLLGDPTRPASSSAGSRRHASTTLVHEMVDADLEHARARRAWCATRGYRDRTATMNRDDARLRRRASRPRRARRSSAGSRQRDSRSSSCARHAELDLRDAGGRGRLLRRRAPGRTCSSPRPGSAASSPTDAYPADFLRDNLLIQTNVIDAAWRNGVRKLLFLGSSCIYPKLAPQPIREDSLLTGPLEPTNEWYAIAKIAGIKMCQAYRRQHGFDCISAMPTNLYGPGDNFNLENSHVLPALIRKFHEAKAAGRAEVVVLGHGLAAARVPARRRPGRCACVFLMRNYSRRGAGQRRLRRGRDDPGAGREVAASRRVRGRAALRSDASPTARRESCWTCRGLAQWAGNRKSRSARGCSGPTAGFSSIRASFAPDGIIFGLNRVGPGRLPVSSL